MSFSFNETATTGIYTLSLHDALPICPPHGSDSTRSACRLSASAPTSCPDRKSTRLNSSHTVTSYAVFCLKQKKLENGGFVKSTARLDIPRTSNFRSLTPLVIYTLPHC